MIEGQDLAVVCAGMYMRSSIGTNCIGAGFFPDSLIVARIWYKREGYTTETSRVEFGLIESLMAHVPSERPVYAETTPGGEESLGLSASKERPTNPPVLLAGKQPTGVSQLDITEQHRRLYIGQSMFGFGFRRGRYHDFNAPPFRSKSLGRAFTQPTKAVSSIAAEQGFLSFQRPFIELTSGDMLRLQLARECYQKYPAFICHQKHKNYEKSYLAHPNQTHQIWLNEYIVSRVQNWPDSEGSCQDSDINGLTVLMSLLVIGAAYGGLHLLAWNPPVSSHTQILMWRISGITLAISAVVPIAGIYTMVACAIMYEKLEKTTAWKDMASKVPEWIRDYVMFVIVLISGLLFYVIAIGGGLLYVFSRVYLLIECVISIPYLPDTVFQTTNWSQYFPHIK